MSAENNLDSLKDSFEKNVDTLKKEIENVSINIVEKNQNLKNEYKHFKSSQIDYYKKLFCYCLCCSCMTCCECFFFCLCCCQKNINSKEKLKEINNKLNEIENINIIEENENSKNSKNSKNTISLRFLFSLYFFSIFHFFALSEVHCILYALLKEIFRTLKFTIRGDYDFKDNVIRDFYYFLTDSNFHDSSQINFNYLTSFFCLILIRLIPSQHKIEIVYIISIVVILIFSLFLNIFDYLKPEVLKENKTNYGGFKIFGFIVFYIMIYVFAGFISLLPNKILDEYIKGFKNLMFVYKLIIFGAMNLVIGISVSIKNYVNYYLILYINCDTITTILILEIVLFIAFSLVYFVFIFLLNCGCSFECGRCLCNNEKENIDINNNDIDSIKEIIVLDKLIEEDDDKNKIVEIKKNEGGNKIIQKKDEISNNFFVGFLFIKTEYIYSFIKVKGFCNYISSIFTNAKIVSIFVINFCARMQKLKFKTDYKKNIKNNNALFLTFLSSFGAYFILYILIFGIYIIYRKCKNNKNNQNNKYGKYFIEGAILGCLSLIFVFVFILSLYYYLEECENISLYISIALTGSVNFLLYDFYSSQEEEYISLSGVVSLSQLVFRGIEFFLEPFDSTADYIIQLVFSSAGGFFTVLYLSSFLKRDIKFCICIKSVENKEINTK